MTNPTGQDSPADSGAASFPGSYTMHDSTGTELELGTITDEHEWEIVVGADGHPSQILCSCGWVGGVLRP